jgi:hypothetical protein
LCKGNRDGLADTFAGTGHNGNFLGKGKWFWHSNAIFPEYKQYLAT